MTHYDTLHYVAASYIVIGTRAARKVAKVLGAVLTSVDGPVMGTVSRTRKTVKVPIVHDAGTDISPTSGIEEFRYFLGSPEITISAAVRTNANTATLTLASEPPRALKSFIMAIMACMM